MSRWQFRQVPLKFQLSDYTLFSLPIALQVRHEKLVDQTPPVKMPTLPSDELVPGSQGFQIRGLPIVQKLPDISRVDNFICYAPLQYQHCYIDLNLTFEQYQKKFSSKTRSTINRKIKKYTEHCGGALLWKTYRLPEEMRDFFQHARAISKLTYQERLLDAGIPGSKTFICNAEAQAAEQRVRAYILFDGVKPVSYLYCPVEDGVLIYAYLGYDPDYMHLSVGTVLQWLAIEQLFKEAQFKYFDFTEGQSDHKRLFATHQQHCANVFLVKKTFRNLLIIYGHRLMDRMSERLGVTMDKLGLKAKIKRFLRTAG